MTTLLFSNAPAERHAVRRHGGGVQVDDATLAVRSLGGGDFVTTVDGRGERLSAVAHGDAIYVQLKGRAWRIERVDATRSRGGASAAAAGASVAPMPGVVVSVHAGVGERVRQGDPLLVIESMKLQMTIGAAADGVVAELPFAVGQTFQRGAVLVRTTAEELAA
ncbi:MAG: acetyl-CoA carboxylase biotin carboxyl carrier protein subunit [Variovorax sp.]|nr:acetyl-CoA carboxylase biotin carboxyl carrier protein subunit [Variovorax sp.]